MTASHGISAPPAFSEVEMAATSWTIAALFIRFFAALVLIYVVLPTFVIVPLSFSSESFLSFPPPGWSLRWYEQLAAQQDYIIALTNSLKIGFPSAALATVLGTMAALALVRGRLPGRDLMTITIIAPLILPPIVLAIALFPIMVRLGLIGTYPAILFGHVVVSMPLVFITVAAALKSYSPSFELAAMTLGANPWESFWHVTFPMIRLGVLVGFIFAFTFSFDEIILALFLTNSATRTLPRLLWEQLNLYMSPLVAAATVVILGVTMLMLLLAAILASRNDARPAEGGP
jgi:ABC-type spermidine/putrescine transport system permease subunit II